MRKILRITVIVSLLTTGIGTAAGSVAGFDDVDTTVYYSEPVQWMVDEGITTGTHYCSFSPHDTLTRGQGAAFIWRMEGSKSAWRSHPFTDVAADWQHDPLSWLAKKGYVTGIAPTLFAPDAPMTRAEFAVVLWRVAGEPSVTGPQPFTDVTVPWQVEAVTWMAKQGFTTGTSPTTFSPNALVSRAQAATFLHRFSGSPAASLDSSPCNPSTSMPTSGSVQAPMGTLGPRTTTAIDPSTVSGISLSSGKWTMNRSWDETTDGGYLEFGAATLDTNGRQIEGFRIEVPTGIESGHVIDGGGTVGHFIISNPDQNRHASLLRHGLTAHHYIARGVVGDAIKVSEGFAYHHDAIIEMNVLPGGSNGVHYDGVQVFHSGSAHLERIVIDWNNAGTIAATTGAIFTQDSSSLTARDILILEPGGTWQPIRLSGSGHHDVARIEVIGTREPNNTNGKLAPTALVKITNGSGTFNLINQVPGADDWLVE